MLTQPVNYGLGLPIRCFFLSATLSLVPKNVKKQLFAYDPIRYSNYKNLILAMLLRQSEQGMEKNVEFRIPETWAIHHLSVLGQMD